MIEIQYICKGSCHGSVKEDDFKKGKNRCQSQTCERKGLPLERRNYCSTCKVHFKEKEPHTCQ